MKTTCWVFHIKSNACLLLSKFPHVPFGMHKRVAENLCCSLYFWWYSEEDIYIQLVIMNKIWTCGNMLCMLVSGLYVKQFAVAVVCSANVMSCFALATTRLYHWIILFCSILYYTNFCGFLLIVHIWQEFVLEFIILLHHEFLSLSVSSWCWSFPHFY